MFRRMTAIRPPKKSESLEIRLPYATKQAFMTRCQADGRTASDALRGFIEAELGPAKSKRPLRYLAVGALAAAALGALAAPSLANTADAARFADLDANRDGAITAAEFARLDADHDGRVSHAEFSRAAARTARP